MSGNVAARVRGLVVGVVAGAALVAPTGALAARQIVGGGNAPASALGFAAFVEAKAGKSSFWCTGSVIAPNVVLTAGHCAVDENGRREAASVFHVYTGSLDLSSRAGQTESRVVKVLTAPKFDLETLVPDEALLVLATPTTAPPVAIATREDTALYTPGAPVVLAGWGEVKIHGYTPDELKFTTSTLQTDRACAAEADEAPILFRPGWMLCTAGTGMACKGDSGGPVIEPVTPAPATPADYRLIGTTSWGDDECGYLSVASSVLPLSDWIAEQVAIAGGAPAAEPAPVGLIPTPLAGAAPAPATPITTTLKLRLVAHGDHWFRVRVIAGPNAPIAQLRVQLQYNTGHGYRSFSSARLVSGRPLVREFSGDPGRYDVRAVVVSGAHFTGATSNAVRFAISPKG
jgi:secreted trypsin-like serine protease